MSPSKLFDSDASEEEIDEELNALGDTFSEYVDKFAQEHDLHLGIVSLLTLRTSLTSRMMDYVYETEKPSGSGLKLELDRFLREVDETVRTAKKGADDFVAVAKQAIAEAEQDEKPE